MSEPPSNNPRESSRSVAAPASNKLSMIGFGLSMAGFASAASVGTFEDALRRAGFAHLGEVITSIALILAFLALPGFLISLIMSFSGASRLARWGVVFGCLTMLFLPTFSLGILWWLRGARGRAAVIRVRLESSARVRPRGASRGGICTSGGVEWGHEEDRPWTSIRSASCGQLWCAIRRLPVRRRHF